MLYKEHLMHLQA